MSDAIKEIGSFLKQKRFPDKPKAAVILGSGLGGFTDAIEIIREIPYTHIPHFPGTSVKGHKGSLFLGRHDENTIIAFSGRFHLYEGHGLETALLPVRVAHQLNAGKLIISNAAGSINYNFSIGDLMAIQDVIHLDSAISPRNGKTFSFNHDIPVSRVQKLAAGIGLDIQRGTYLFAKGPSYETKAEIRAFRRLGADVVGMSTAPELFEASKLSLKTAAISLVTNMASGVSKHKLNHDEIKEAADTRGRDFNKLVLVLINKL